MNNASFEIIAVILFGILAIVMFIGPIFRNEDRYGDENDFDHHHRGHRGRRGRRRGRGGYRNSRRHRDDEYYPRRRRRDEYDEYEEYDEYDDEYDHHYRRDNFRSDDDDYYPQRNNNLNALAAFSVVSLIVFGAVFVNKASDGPSSKEVEKPTITVTPPRTIEQPEPTEGPLTSSVQIPGFVQTDDMDEQTVHEETQEKQPAGPPCVVQMHCISDEQRIREIVGEFRSYGLPVCTSDKGGCTAIGIGPFPSREDARIIQKEYGFDGNIVPVQGDEWIKQ